MVHVKLERSDCDQGTHCKANGEFIGCHMLPPSILVNTKQLQQESQIQVEIVVISDESSHNSILDADE